MTIRRMGGLGVLMIALSVMVWPVAAQRSQTAVETKIDGLKDKLDRGEKILLVDVRRDDEVKSGSIPGSVHIPMAELEIRMKDIPKDVQIVFACDHGDRSSRAAELFEKNGYKASTFCALQDWKDKGYKTSEPKRPAPGTIKP